MTKILYEKNVIEKELLQRSLITARYKAAIKQYRKLYDFKIKNPN